MGERKVIFNISANYQVVKIIGEGAYGLVCLAIHKPSKTWVAIKKIEPFQKPLFCLRTLREIKLLNKFKYHENIINLYDIQKPLDYNNFNEIYLIQQYMPSDLHRVIYTKTLSDDHIQYFIYQIIRGVKFIHSAGVIHRDLKPSNILVNNDCDIKICDFGLSRINSESNLNKFENLSNLTEYVTTRYYRAPEIMITQSQYTTAVDLWSIGCILAEILILKPLFPGQDCQHQLNLIFDFIGTPTSDDLQFINSKRSKQYLQSMTVSNFRYPCDMAATLNYSPERFTRVGSEPINPLAIDLISKLLVFDPKNRINIDEALSHPYLTRYHDPNDEPICEPISTKDFEFDTNENKLDLKNLKKQIFDEVMTFKRR